MLIGWRNVSDYGYLYEQNMAESWRVWLVDLDVAGLIGDK